VRATCNITYARADIFIGPRRYPGVFYAFDKHERHKYRLDTDVRAIAIFNPPLIGDETNDEEGGYAKADDYKAR